MKRRNLWYLASIVILVVVMLSAKTVEARTWISGNEKYFTIDQVCHDGARLRAAADLDPPPDTYLILLSSRLYRNPALQIPFIGMPYAIEDYGPALLPAT